MQDNTKKPTQKSKKRKAGLFLGLGLGALVAGSAATLLATIGKYRPGEDIKFNLNFTLSEEDKNQGATLTGESKFNFKNEIYLSEINVPVAEKTITESATTTNYPFVDWIDDAGLTVKYNDAITQTTKLTATFSDYWEKKGVTLYNVTFKTDDPELYMTGVTRLAVPAGRTFASINKPQVFSTNPVKNKFKGWALESYPTYTVNQDLLITQNLVFVPVFATSVVMNYNTRDGETVTGGTPQVTVEAGVKFGEINQPTVVRDSSVMFAGWTKDEEGTEDWSSDEIIGTDKAVYNAWAKWITKQDVNTAILKFIPNTDKGSKQPIVTFTGSTDVGVKVNSTWTQINRPTPAATGWKLSGWEYSKTQAEPRTDWKTLEGTEVFDQHGKDGFVYYIRPIMTPNADAVKILGKDTAIQGLSTQYTAFVAPAEADQKVVWQLFADEGCKTPLSKDIAEITDTGLLKVYNGESKPIYIKATSVVDSEGKVFDVKKVTLIPPYFDSYDYFTFHENTTDPSKSKWYKLTGLDGADVIQAWDGDTLVTTYPRAVFNIPVFVGERIKTLPGQFLANCSSFNQPIVWTDKLQNIGPYFMYGCEAFNQELKLDYIQNIDKEFMFWCRSFNNGLSSNATEVKKLSLTDCYRIGEGFMDQCVSFNCPLDLGTKITHIGKEFMNQCEKFNQDITFPASLTSIGDNCMHNCYDFTSTITVATASTNFGNSDLNFSADKKTAKIFDQGFFVDGDSELRTAFVTKFGTIEYPSTTETGSAYRKISAIADFKTCSWKFLGQLCTDFENGVITQDQFFSKIRVNDKHPTSLKDFVGIEKTLKVNGYDHIVRCVATQYDQLSSSTNEDKKYATFTFEFKSLISDSNGDILSCFWNETKDKDTHDYLNSTLYKNLTGKGNGIGGWYEKSAATKSTKYKDMSLINMVDPTLREQLKDIVRTVSTRKTKSTQTWITTTYNTNFYMPFCYDVGAYKGLGYTPDGTSGRKVFDWYKDIGTGRSYQWIHKPANVNCIVTNSTTIKDALHTASNCGLNYDASYGTSTETQEQSKYHLNYVWTGSPGENNDYSEIPYSIRHDGTGLYEPWRFMQVSCPNDTTLPIAPAFAI